jgi:hypothetical protein
VIINVVGITRLDFALKNPRDSSTVCCVLFLAHFSQEMDKWKIANEKKGRKHLYDIQTKPQIA